MGVPITGRIALRFAASAVVCLFATAVVSAAAPVAAGCDSSQPDRSCLRRAGAGLPQLDLPAPLEWTDSGGGSEFGSRLLAFLVVSAIPNVGFCWEGAPGSSSHALFSWPLSFPLGELKGSDRLVLEPGFVVPGSFFFRPGYRFWWQPGDGAVGLGGGLGVTIQASPTRVSLSPELLVRFRVRDEGFSDGFFSYVPVTVRYDRFFDGTPRNRVLVHVGLSVW